MEEFFKNKLDWSNEKSAVCFPHAFTPQQKIETVELLKSAPDLTSHLWVSSSGTSQNKGDSLNWMALSKLAFLTSADAVNEHLQVSVEDRWGVVLPLSHVGGISILARAYLSNSNVFFYFDQHSVWNADRFWHWCRMESITLLSLVPTQLFDLCKDQLVAPASVRAVVIGGGSLTSELCLQARALGWPVLPSFGMTEACSQIATAELTSLLEESGEPPLKVLSHIQAETDQDQTLRINSASLLTGSLQRTGAITQYHEPVTNGWLQTDDLVELSLADNSQWLRSIGRRGQWAKIKGYNVFLPQLQQELEKFFFSQGLSTVGWMLAFRRDERLGARVVFVHTPLTDSSSAAEKIQQWHKQRPKHVEIAEIEQRHELPLTELGKQQIWI